MAQIAAHLEGAAPELEQMTAHCLLYMRDEALLLLHNDTYMHLWCTAQCDHCSSPSAHNTKPAMHANMSIYGQRKHALYHAQLKAASLSLHPLYAVLPCSIARTMPSYTQIYILCSVTWYSTQQRTVCEALRSLHGLSHCQQDYSAALFS